MSATMPAELADHDWSWAPARESWREAEWEAELDPGDHPPLIACIHPTPDGAEWAMLDAISGDPFYEDRAADVAGALAELELSRGQLVEMFESHT